ncbi:MAG: POTRA domain-containing protein, partial [Myxococcales bacterium]
MTAAEAAQPVPETGAISKIEIQGNRRVEGDAIRAALPVKPGDTFDKRKLKDALLAVWKMGYFNDVKLDVSRAKPPAAGYQLTVLVSEKPAVRDIRLEGN